MDAKADRPGRGVRGRLGEQGRDFGVDGFRAVEVDQLADALDVVAGFEGQSVDPGGGAHQAVGVVDLLTKLGSGAVDGVEREESTLGVQQALDPGDVRGGVPQRVPHVGPVRRRHLSLVNPCGSGSPAPIVGVLWRVVNPSTVLERRHQSFVSLLERGLDRWRPHLQEVLADSDDEEPELLTEIANDRYWARSLGIRVSLQVINQRYDGHLNLDASKTSWQFIFDAFSDRRRWFPFVEPGGQRRTTLAGENRWDGMARPSPRHHDRYEHADDTQTWHRDPSSTGPLPNLREDAF